MGISLPVLGVPTLIGAAFSPINISNLAGWWDSSDTSTLWQDSARTVRASINDVVGAWDDKSGSVRHMLQATTANKPILKSSGILGDGVNDALATSAFSAITITAQTVFAVIGGITAASSNGRVFTQTDGITADFALADGLIPLLRNGATADKFSSFYNSDYRSIISPVNNNTDYIMESRHGGGMLVNSLDGIDGTPYAVSINRDFDMFGCFNALNGSGLFQGLIYELIVYTRLLSDGERKAVRTYLNNKWSVY